ncbi:MAG: hypothetical protein DSY82_03375 [Flavobacteriia bacterium]|nr:MAG: hypothetical protein DSY82_03375 [Flavobacteriia bacterium]
MKQKIFNAIENDEKIKLALENRTNIKDWKNFTRTHFNIIAKEINKKVSEKVTENPVYISDYLLLGKDKVENLAFQFNLKYPAEVIDYLDLSSSNKPFNWISGKTLERYWTDDSVKPKDLKLNVLLTYLEVPIKDWDEWKYYSSPNTFKSAVIHKPQITEGNDLIISPKDKIFFKNIRRYYLGSYYLYYIKTDNKRIVKTPFIIKEEGNKVVIESTSEGHRYKSTVIKNMLKSLYVVCTNLDWEQEEEVYLFNIGLETKPEVIFGVSITLTSKSGIPVAIKNVLIKQSTDVNYLDNESETEINFNSQNSNEEESTIVEYFKKVNSQILFAEYCCTFQEFKESLENEQFTGQN